MISKIVSQSTEVKSRADCVVGPALYIIRHYKTKKFYIGSTLNIQRRWDEHTTSLRKQRHPNRKLQKAYNEDKNLQFFVFSMNTLRDANDAELKTILANVDNPLLLNVRHDVAFDHDQRAEKISNTLKGHDVSEETRKKIGLAAKGNKYWVGRKHSEATKNKLRKIHLGNSYAKGHSVSDSVRAKLRAKALGRKHTNATKEKVSLNSSRNKPVVINGRQHYNCASAGRDNGVTGDTIRRWVLDDRYPDCYYAKDEKAKIKPNPNLGKSDAQ